MKSAKVEAAINQQINEEFASAYRYLAMSGIASGLGLPGFANWFKLQYREELVHAEKFFNFLLERDGVVQLTSLPQPEVKNPTPLGLFEDALASEQHISECIFKLKDLARAESDHATDVFLEWFVNEQVEEESNARGVLDQLKMAAGNNNLLFLIDRELAGRQTEPSV